MDWIEVTVHTTTAGSDAVAEFMQELGAQGSAIEDRHDLQVLQQDPTRWDFIEDELIASMSPDVLVKSYFPDNSGVADTLASIRQRMQDWQAEDLGFDMGSLQVETAKLGDVDWYNNWKKYYHPFAVGEKLWIQPQWIDTPAPEGRVMMRIDPGLAFGSGTHETTFMCMDLLEQVVTPGMHVADVGCGTGILAIVCRLLGAGNVLAVDRDDVSVSAAHNNIAINPNCQDICVQKGDLLHGVEDTFDLVVANIIAEVINILIPDVAEKLTPNGYFLCSGIIHAKREMVEQTLAQYGFEVVRVLTKGEWVAILARRKH